MITFSTWLTLARIFLSPCIMIAIYGQVWMVAIFLFSCAALTDFFDGYYARLYNQQTRLGQILDPIADKILLCMTLLGFCLVFEQAIIPLWFVYLVIMKEFILLCGGLILYLTKKSMVIEPSLISKWITALTMAFFIYIMFSYAGYAQCYYVNEILKILSIGMVFVLSDYSYKFYEQI